MPGAPEQPCGCIVPVIFFYPVIYNFLTVQCEGGINEKLNRTFSMITHLTDDILLGKTMFKN